MAGGDFISNTGTNLNLYVTWSSVPNVAANNSTVTMNVFVRSYSITVGSRTDSVMVCNGEVYTYSTPAISRPKGSDIADTHIGSKSFIVPHNSDGTKAMTLEARWKLNGTYEGKTIGWITCSLGVILDNIPRNATLTAAPDFVSDQNPTITFSNPGGYALNARIEFGGTSIARNNISNTGSYTFSLSAAERDLLHSKCPSSTTLSVQFVVATKYDGNTEAYVSKLTKTMTVRSGNPTFTALTPTIVNGTVPSGWGIYVQGKSRCALAITGAAGIYGSTIKNYAISGGGFSGTSSTLTTGVLASSGSITFTGTITDSRGRTASKTVTITVQEYSPPRVTVGSTSRCNSGGVLTDDGKYAKCIASTTFSSCSSKNTATRKVYYRQNASQPWSAGTVFNNNTAVVIGGNALNVDLSYQIRYEIADAFVAVSFIDTLSTAFTTMDFKQGGHGVAVGKVSELADTFECAFDAEFYGSVEVNGKAVWTDAEDSGWIYPTLINGWVEFGTSNARVRYRCIKGMVFLEGMVKTGTIGTAIFTVDTPYIPARNRLMITLTRTTASVLTMGHILVARGTGEVSAASGANGYVSLDGLQYGIG